MPFYSEDENEHFLDDASPLSTERARMEAAGNVAMMLHEEIDHPKMFVQTIDPETGLPLDKKLVEGGIEYFNEGEGPVAVQPAYDIDTILSGDLSLDDVMRSHEQRQVDTYSNPVRSNSIPRTSPSGIPQVQSPSIDHFNLLKEFGLDFLRTQATIPDQPVQICCTGLVTFQVPFPCHKIIQTDSLVVLVTDTRGTGIYREMDFKMDPKTVQVELLCFEQTVIPILPPVPNTVSFELGVLRFTLFLKRRSNDTENQ